MTRIPFLSQRAMLGGVLYGAAYGIAARLATNHKVFGQVFGEAFSVMTVGFLFVVPLVIGFLTVRPVAAPSVPFRLFAPWLPCAIVVVVAAAVGWEGTICIVLALPVMLVLSSLGGLLGGAGAARRAPGVLPALLLLPYLVAPLEQRRALRRELATTHDALDIAAPASVVWPLVASVDSIRPEEERPALFTAMGFPHPVSAVLSHPGIGGVREARFTGGLVFREAVTRWEPERAISFTIRANTAEVPPTTLDPHVTIGGPYFDVLTGTYELEPIPGGVRLHLSSEHRVSTRFNPYAEWWADRLMQSIQSNILQVIRARAERRVAPSSTLP